MAYNPNIPVVTDYMVNSQVQIRSNFQTINSVFSKNHVRLNATEGGDSQGMHNVLTLRTQSGDPVTTSSQIALYTKVVGSDIAIFYAPSSAQTPIQLTYPSISTGLQSTDPDVFLSRQYTFMAGPFVVYVGKLLELDGTVITLLPATTLIYVGLVGNGFLGTDKTAACATNVSGNQFTVRFSDTGAPPVKYQMYYLAIGI